MAGDEDAVHAMLRRFARAFTSGDGPAAAACWEVPALVVADEGTRAVSTLEEVAAFFGGAAKEYHAQGVTGTRVDVQRIEWHTQRLASVTVRWPWLDGQGAEVGRAESSVYVVRLDGGAARICAVVMRGMQ
ncbi:MAG: hypothetical protein EOO30_14170 [Comamonadaceae bacterium]|nr:MAG: hypothetical protein EOO30_14170 [Comamonadaceae bacterium]